MAPFGGKKAAPFKKGGGRGPSPAKKDVMTPGDMKDMKGKMPMKPGMTFGARMAAAKKGKK